MECRGQTQGRIAKLLQVKFIGFCSAQEFDPCLAQSVFVIRFDKTQIGRATWQKYIYRLCATGLDALGKWGKVGGANRHADRLHHLPTLLAELCLESVFSINARRVVRHRGDHFFQAFFRRVLRDGHGHLPQGVAGAQVIVRLGGDVRGGRVEHHHRCFGLLDHRRHCERIGGKHDPTQIIHFVFDHQLLGQGFGVCRIGAAFITVNQLDVLPGQFAALRGQIRFSAGFEQSSVMGERPRKRGNDAHLHGLGRGATQAKGHQADRPPCFECCAHDLTP